MQNTAGFLGSSILEVVIGLSFLYFLLSAIASSINELIASRLLWRAKDLEKALLGLLGPALFERVAGNPLLSTLGRNAAGGEAAGRLSGRPSYIPAPTFAWALLEAVANVDPRSPAAGGGPAGSDPAPAGLAKAPTVRSVEAQARALAAGGAGGDAAAARLGAALLSLIAQGRALPAPGPGPESAAPEPAADLDRLQKRIESWFDDAMDRASGVYKRNVQAFLFAVGLLLAVLIGADSLRFVSSLYLNPVLRAALLAQAQNASPPSGSPSIPDLAAGLEPYGDLFGYGDVPTTARPGDRPLALFWLQKAVGALITAFAVAVGAPFWFQLIQKLVNLRGTGPRPEAGAAERRTSPPVASG
jgi:hypothetical protein